MKRNFYNGLRFLIIIYLFRRKDRENINVHISIKYPPDSLLIELEYKLFHSCLPIVD